MARHSRTNTDIKPVREIDIENASKDELIEYLCQTIHYEVEKGEDADCDLIRECSDWLGELTADKIVFTPEELDAKLEAIKTGKYTNTAKPHKPSHIHHVTKRKVFARVTILVASLVLLSFLSLSALAMNAGYDSTWEYVVTNINNILELNFGDKMHDNGITIKKYSGKTHYDSIHEWIEADDLNILYPHKTPDEIRITEIRIIEKSHDNTTIYFSFSNNLYAFDVSDHYSIDLSNLQGFEIINVNEFNYYVIQKENGIYFAILQDNGYEYTIKAPNYDNLLSIINNTKG